MKKVTSTTNTAATVAEPKVELSAKDVAQKLAVAKIDAEYEAKKKAEYAAKAAAKEAKVIPEGKAKRVRKPRVKFTLPAGVTALEYITAWATGQSEANNQVALLKVCKSLSRFEHSGQRSTARIEIKQLEREIARIHRGLQLAGIDVAKYPESVNERLAELNDILFHLKAAKAATAVETK
jgi:hypothetical protein